MTTFRAVFVSITLVACVQSGLAGQLAPVTEFTLNGYKTEEFARGVDSGPYGFFGFIQEVDSTNEVWETFIEFDLGLLPLGSNATLNLNILNGAGVVPVARTFDVSVYDGTGAPDISLIGAGHLLTTLAVDAPPAPHNGIVQTFSLDISSAVDAASSNGVPYLGFRFHHPVNVTSGSEYWPMVEYQGGSIVFSSVPEPSSFALFALSIAGPLAIACWRRRKPLLPVR